jgi:hypothetical protein
MNWEIFMFSTLIPPIQSEGTGNVYTFFGHDPAVFGHGKFHRPGPPKTGESGNDRGKGARLCEPRQRGNGRTRRVYLETFLLSRLPAVTDPRAIQKGRVAAAASSLGTR